MPEAAVPLAPNVYRIPTAPFDMINSFAFVDDSGAVTLVDCGLRNAPPRIVAGLAAFGKTPRDVTRIILTHAHPDHVGGAADLAGRAGVRPEIHTDDAPFARRGQFPPRDERSRLGRLFNRVSRDRRSYQAFEPGHELADGELVDVAGGLRVVHTPGHSPGHVSLLHEPTGVLVTGDAIFNVRRLRWPVLAFCSDYVLTQQTAHRLAELEYTVAGFTHGTHVSDRAREKVRAFLADEG